MSDIAMTVEHLGKSYRIGRAQQRHDTLRDALASRLRGLAKSGDGRRTTDDGTIWALKDVSFEVQRGEVVGIIGRNGAGKSTLLKILSRITEPTEGRAVIHGRVGSLLEVGTGFHPELTGRENIYLNGAILGMRRAEIARKFDAIVAFAEIEKFLDTPVKRYSSGMYVRLAFAVAAHLEPEIFIVDEVLAVGDAAFQKKCLGKMGDVAHEGRTVLFVSHNMGAIAQLCSTSVLLQSGCVAAIDKSDKVIHQYLGSGLSEHPEVNLDPNANPQSAVALVRCWVGDEGGRPIHAVDVSRSFCISFCLDVRNAFSDVEFSARIHNGLGQALFTSNISQSLAGFPRLEPGRHTLAVTIPANFLAPGSYLLSLGIHRPNVELLAYHESLLAFEVEESGSDMWIYRGGTYGNILVRFEWHVA
jgi:lipopolysaccharide transport system ATP-binding protein